jgi:capsular polysaccharide biosynthesis protein
LSCIFTKAIGDAYILLCNDKRVGGVQVEQTDAYISYKDIIRAVKKRLLVFVLITALCVCSTIAYRTLIARPVYEAGASLLINIKSDVDPNASPGSGYNMPTYVKLFKTNAAIVKVITDLKLDVSPEYLIKQINAQYQDGTQIIDIYVKWSDPDNAALILDTLIEVFSAEFARLFPKHTAHVMDRVPPQIYTALDDKLYYGAAFAIGILLSLFIALTIEMTDNTLKSEDDIEKHLDIPVINIKS